MDTPELNIFSFFFLFLNLSRIRKLRELIVIWHKLYFRIGNFNANKWIEWKYHSDDNNNNIGLNIYNWDYLNRKRRQRKFLWNWKERRKSIYKIERGRKINEYIFDYLIIIQLQYEEKNQNVIFLCFSLYFFYMLRLNFQTWNNKKGRETNNEFEYEIHYIHQAIAFLPPIQYQFHSFNFSTLILNIFYIKIFLVFRSNSSVNLRTYFSKSSKNVNSHFFKRNHYTPDQIIWSIWINLKHFVLINNRNE